jgi:hypothetical protein
MKKKYATDPVTPSLSDKEISELLSEKKHSFLLKIGLISIYLILLIASLLIV